MPLEINKAECYGYFERGINHFRSENNGGFHCQDGVWAVTLRVYNKERAIDLSIFIILGWFDSVELSWYIESMVCSIA